MPNRYLLRVAKALALVVPGALSGLPASAGAAETSASARCEAHGGPLPLRVVELYTSEGCDSCPPADRWLSTLKGRPDLVAVAFHVDYWDRLGWVDRFGSPSHTQRQAEQQAASGARFSYTPQVLVDGRDWRRWPALPATSVAAAPVQVSLQRSERQVIARVQALPGAPQRLAAWWAVLEDGHQSMVKAGENRGATLHHDHVVRDYARLPPFASSVGARAWTLPAPTAGADGRSQRLVLVVTDAVTGLPLQAVQLAC